jgi:hypothetical protein
MILGHTEGRGALRPINATSDWLWGDAAVSDARADTSRTATGFITHELAMLFWSTLLETALGPRKRTLPVLALGGAATAAVAAVVDYALVPRRLSPGWELALTRKSMAGAFGAMAAGLVAGALASRGGKVKRRAVRRRR